MPRCFYSCPTPPMPKKWLLPILYPPCKIKLHQKIKKNMSILFFFRFLFNKESNRKAGRAVKYKYHQSEIDFIIKFASVLVQNTSASNNQVSIDW